jgi:hypothetical protein
MAHRTSWAVPAAGLGLVVVALAGASLLRAGGPSFRATPASLRSVVTADMGPVSRDPGSPASNGLARVRAVRCADDLCWLAYNADRTRRMHTRGELQNQLRQVFVAVFRDPRLRGMQMTAWGPTAAGQARLFAVDCTRADVGGANPAASSDDWLRSRCSYRSFARAGRRAA